MSVIQTRAKTLLPVIMEDKIAHKPNAIMHLPQPTQSHLRLGVSVGMRPLDLATTVVESHKPYIQINKLPLVMELEIVKLINCLQSPE